MGRVLALVAKIILVVITRSASILWIATKFFGRLARQQLRRRTWTFGSARFASLIQLLRTGCLGGQGLILARKAGRFVRYNNREGSAVVFAPQGSGKGVGPVISNLLDYRGSVVVTDPPTVSHSTPARLKGWWGAVCPPHPPRIFRPG